MKIAQLSTRYPPGPGGVERHVGEISRRLAARGHEVHAYATELYREYPWERLAPDVPRSEVAEGVRVHRLPAWSLPGELHYPFFRGLGRALARDAPDLLHVHTYGTNHAAVAHRRAVRTRTPFVLTAHYHPIWSIEGGWLRHRIRGFYDGLLAAPIVAAADRLIVQSREEERLIRENGFALPPVETIAPGYTPLPAPDPNSRTFAETFGIVGPYVLFVGRLASNKGLLPLVEAFQGLARHDSTAVLAIVGEDGGQRAAVERKVRELGLARQVRILGYVADERLLASAFRDARLFVLPSEYEAFGLVLLEALAHATPVIASRVGGIPEFIEHNRSGLLVPRLDAPALTEAILALWDDPVRRSTLGRFGQEHVVPRYSWDLVTDRLESIYAEVTGS